MDMICSDFTETKYYIPNIEIGSIGFLQDEEDFEPIVITSRIIYDEEPERYEKYLELPQEARNDYMKSDLSCEFLLENMNVIIGFRSMRESDLNVIAYC